MANLIESRENILSLEQAIYEYNVVNMETLCNEKYELWSLLEKIHAWFQKIQLDEIETVFSCDSKTKTEQIALLVQASMDKTWELLNTGTWKNVPEYIKHIYSLLGFYKMATTLLSKSPVDWNLKLMEDCIHMLDKGILLGYNNPHMTKAVELLMGLYNAMVNNGHSEIKSNWAAVTSKSSVVMSSWKITGIRGVAIQELSAPSLLTFQSNFLTVRRPVKLRDCVSHWPALAKWDLAYFRKLAGSRLVPIEIGKKYTDEDWSQRLMSLNRFLDEHMCEHSHAYLAQHDLLSQIPQLKQDIVVPDYCYLHPGDNIDSSLPIGDSTNSSLLTDQSGAEEKQSDGFIHNDENEEETEAHHVDLNMWFGPPGTVTPFHWDAKHNLLVQVLGSKRVLLTGPDSHMYPYEGLLNNTSRVDPELDLDILTREFPDFVKHPGKDLKCETSQSNSKEEAQSSVPHNQTPGHLIECTLNPGDMLYIPPKVWHHVRSLSTSISVSFWF
ncbi:lysine-specific demethylase 8-like [Diaphorina citri]|uniref:Lysine-specific demethylase 8-like n=1 Tax=Diaphorina citri TaxID=121845 RepID=A0A1S4E6D9_DIACI|nr:lysine-specific demethylase 8-like [Diaphorina citri]XP_026676333.1 lysine-specific demethylase 8-like [Diaphorina citri]XP_026676334.1 lysine-specific demethylase 8-like [Diaphorina citri]